MKQLLSLLILISLFSCTPKESPLAIDLTSKIVSPKHYIVTKTTDALIIDGVADEASWQLAKFTDSFIDIEGVKIPKYDTKVKMLWDEHYLYVYAQLQEPHVWGNLRQRDTIIYFNNDFEVFIDPSNDTKDYGEIEINALGTVWDLLLNKPYRSGGHANSNWNLDQLKSAVQIQGTLNNPADLDKGWTVEMAIPLTPLIVLRNKRLQFPKEGEHWRINFSRVNWDYQIIDGVYHRKKENDKYLKEYNWVWSAQKKINMHEPEKWGFLQFTNESTSTNVPFIEDEFQKEKQVAYALFRQTRYDSLKSLLNKKTGFIQELKVKYSATESLKAIFYKTNAGFEFKILSTKTKQSFIINEEGTLKIR